MIFIDTSAWIEFLRDSGSDVCNAVDELLAANVAICDPISMEILAGAPLPSAHRRPTGHRETTSPTELKA